MVALFISLYILHKNHNQDFVSAIESMQGDQYILIKKDGIDKTVHQ